MGGKWERWIFVVILVLQAFTLSMLSFQIRTNAGLIRDDQNLARQTTSLLCADLKADNVNLDGLTRLCKGNP
jgi:hypothetical protein